jgi:hypothetical protein
MRGAALAVLLLSGLIVTVPARAADPQSVGAAMGDSLNPPRGVFINIVTTGGAMAATGLMPGDVITAVDGKPVYGLADFDAVIAAHKFGDRLRLNAQHLGKPLGKPGNFMLVLAPSVNIAPGAIAGTASPPAQARAAGRHPDKFIPAAQAPAARAFALQMAWSTYADPSEHAFSIAVPAGWRVSGGLRRMNAVDIRTGVDAVSPDGAFHLFFGDVNVPVFTVPSRYMAMAGLRPGMMYNPGGGISMMIEPYQSGQNFAAAWGGQRLRAECANVALASSRPRPDASSAISNAYGAGGIRTSIAAGEASFSCQQNGAAAAGYVFAGTESVQMQASALWDVKTLVGFIAPEARAGEADAMLSHMVAGFTIDRSWMARQQGITAEFDRTAAAANEAVSNAIIARGRALSAQSDAIFQRGQNLPHVGASRSSTDAIDRYDENAVRGTSDYTNPDTGTSRTLDNSYAHTYTDPSGNIRQTDSETAPGPGWTELQRGR